MRKCFHCFTFCLAALFSAPSIVHAETTWTEVRSPHFRVLTDGSARDGREVANEFEQIRHVFAGLLTTGNIDSGSSLTIVAARDEGSFRNLEPGLWKTEKGLASSVAGIFHPGWEKRFAAVRLDLWQGEAQATVYHEYTHSVLHATAHWLPIWLDEGMAEFYGYTRFQSDKIYVGAPSLRMRELKSETLIPVEQMLDTNSRSKIWEDPQRADLFYAEAWAMVHFMYFGPGMNNGQKLQAFYRAIQNNTDQKKAFRDVFGDPAAFDRALSLYLNRFAFTAARMPPDHSIDPKSFAERELARAEADYELGCFHLGTHDSAAGRTMIEHALSLDPKLAPAHEELGYIDFLAGHDSDARSEWQQALAFDPHLYRSLFALTMTGSTFAQQTPAQLHDTQVQLQRVTTLAPHFAPAFVELALLEWRLGAMQQAYKDSHHAEELEPWRAGYHIVTGNILLHGNQPTLAATSARYVADHWFGPDHNEAVDLWEAVPAAKRDEGPVLARDLPPGVEVAHGLLAAVSCTDAPGPDHLKITLTPSDPSAHPLSFTSDGRIMIGFSDSLWWGEDHFTTCHHLDGHPAIVAYKAARSGNPQLVEFEVRDDLPQAALSTAAAAPPAVPSNAQSTP
jgi:tetratricopeptide (TPR) repeat protein